MSEVYIATKVNFSEVLHLRPILMGLWCLPSNMSDQQLQNYVSELTVLFSEEFINDEYIQSLYIRLIPLISSNLNKYHGITLKDLQWETIVGYWLITIINPLLDRWNRVEQVSELSPNSEILVCSRPLDYEPRFENMEDKRFGNSEHFNSFIYEEIISYFPNLSCRQISEPTEIGSRSTRYPLIRILSKSVYLLPWLKSALKRALFNSFFRRTRLFSNQEVFIIASWLPLRALIYLSWKAKRVIIPNNLTFPPPNTRITKSKVDSVYLSGFTPQNSFEEFLRIHLFSLFPSSLLGDFQSQIQYIKNKNLDFIPKVTLSNLQHCTGYDYVRIWFGLYGNSKHQLYVMQHGGAYGQFKFHWSAFYEQRIAKKFLSWGWAVLSEDQTKFTDVPALRLCKVKSPVIRKKMGPILVLLSPELRMTGLPLPSQPYNSNLQKLYLDRIFELSQKLDESKFDMLKIRPQSNYFQMTSDYLKKNSPGLSLEDQRSPYQLSKAFVLISTYNGTNSLECLKSGRPTIFFWDKRYASYTQGAQLYLDELARTGVLQYESSGVAELLNQDSTHILSWWHSAEVQKAVSAYLAKFGDTSGGAKKWASTVSELYHLEIEKY
jgi:putative transferase (TIGR04331 family)